MEDTAIPDLWHEMGQDLQLTPSGGIRLASGTVQGQQKIIRRLLTSPIDLLYDVDYGAGLPKMIGNTSNEAKVKAIIKTQMQKEPIVVQSPGPKVGVIESAGLYVATIQYVDNTTLETSEIYQLKIAKG